jgi:hypothetical protein
VKGCSVIILWITPLSGVGRNILAWQKEELLFLEAIRSKKQKRGEKVIRDRVFAVLVPQDDFE